MLALVSHEPHFCLLREVVKFGGGGSGQPSREVLENPSEDGFQLLQVRRRGLGSSFRLGCIHSQLLIACADCAAARLPGRRVPARCAARQGQGGQEG